MPRGESIDVLELQKLLKTRADRRGVLKLQQRQLAVELGVTHFAVCRVLARMEEQGLIKRIGTGHRNVGSYWIKEPG